MRNDQHRAASHFGLGSSARDVYAMGDDPAGWLIGQIQPGLADPGPAVPPSSQTIATDTNATVERRRAQRAAEGNEERVARVREMQRAFRRQTRETLTAQTAARVQYALTTDAPYRERLVHFWSNHFTVSRQGRPQIIGSCQAYENEAVRTNLDGRFEDMLLAVVSHPVMLYYLDNVQSMGPDSVVGRRRNMGLNENLAREIMELHTLGVDGGYTQDDVKSLGAMLTGWTVGNPRLLRVGAEVGQFVFVPMMHQPGTFELLGRKYPEGGEDQARSALKDLARHPSTARFLATKLARHFVADDPPARAVNELARVYQETGGHLPSLHRAVVTLKGAWDVENKKLKTPFEYLVSIHRGFGAALTRPEVALQTLRLMNHSPFTAPSPAGWPDRDDHWGSPAALKQRIEWAVAFGRRAADGAKVREVAEWMVPPGAGALVTSLRQAESASQALGLLLASPDFQWR